MSSLNIKLYKKLNNPKNEKIVAETIDRLIELRRNGDWIEPAPPCLNDFLPEYLDESYRTQRTARSLAFFLHAFTNNWDCLGLFLITYVEPNWSALKWMISEEYLALRVQYQDDEEKYYAKFDKDNEDEDDDDIAQFIGARMHNCRKLLDAIDELYCHSQIYQYLEHLFNTPLVKYKIDEWHQEF